MSSSKMKVLSMVCKIDISKGLITLPKRDQKIELALVNSF